MTLIFGDAVLPVPGNARHVRYQGIAGAGQPVEQGGLAHVGTANDSNI